MITTIALAGLGVAGALCLVRLLRAGSLSDRIVALDTLLVVIVCSLAVDAARTGKGTFLDVMVVAALLGFVGTVTIARYIGQRGA